MRRRHQQCHPYNCVFFFTRRWAVPGPADGHLPTHRADRRLYRRQRPDRPRRQQYRVCRGRTATISTCSPIMRSATPSSCSSRPSSSASIRSAQNDRPTFIQGAHASTGFRERIRLDNPFLTSAERTQITNLLLPYNTAAAVFRSTARPSRRSVRPSRQYRQRLVPRADPKALPGSRRCATKPLSATPIAPSIGLRGTFNDDWSYEISANYGRVNEATTVLGNVDFAASACSRWTRAAIPPPARSSAARNSIRTRPDRRHRRSDQAAGDIAACVPYNPIGSGTNNEAARQYIVHDTTSHARLDQLVLSAFISGDSSQWFNLPGGPVGFAIGAEYRRENTVLPGRSVRLERPLFLQRPADLQPSPFA